MKQKKNTKQKMNKVLPKFLYIKYIEKTTKTKVGKSPFQQNVKQ